MFKNYDGVLKVEKEVGVKKFYDPRGYLKKAENSMKDRVIEAIKDLRGDGTTLGK
jgi:fructose-bisphosphate aldolase class II